MIDEEESLIHRHSIKKLNQRNTLLSFFFLSIARDHFFLIFAQDSLEVINKD